MSGRDPCRGHIEVEIDDVGVVECRDDGLRGDEASEADVTRTDPPGAGCANVRVGEARLRSTEFGAPFAGRVGPLLPASERAEPATPGPANPGPDGPCRAG